MGERTNLLLGGGVVPKWTKRHREDLSIIEALKMEHGLRRTKFGSQGLLALLRQRLAPTCEQKEWLLQACAPERWATIIRAFSDRIDDTSTKSVT